MALARNERVRYSQVMIEPNSELTIVHRSKDTFKVEAESWKPRLGAYWFSVKAAESDDDIIKHCVSYALAKCRHKPCASNYD